MLPFGDPNADPATVVATVGGLGAIQDEVLNRIETAAADRIGRRTSMVEWESEARQIGEGLQLGRLIGALRQQFMVVG